MPNTEDVAPPIHLKRLSGITCISFKHINSTVSINEPYSRSIVKPLFMANKPPSVLLPAVKKVEFNISKSIVVKTKEPAYPAMFNGGLKPMFKTSMYPCPCLPTIPS